MGLAATGGDGSVTLDWANDTESDLGGYLVYRGDVSGGPYTQLTAPTVAGSAYVDASATNGTTWFYVVTAVDTSGNESAISGEASATPTGGGSGAVVAWITEFHYDNHRGDENEFVEIAGAAGLDLTGWTVVGYNGNGV